MKYGAVIVETRPENLRTIIENHFRFLPSDWGLTFFGSKENEEIVKYIAPDCNFIKLPQSLTRVFNAREYNEFITSPGFWGAVPYDKVLIFQHDSKLLRHGITDFLEWDYVGAPWKHINLVGGNGGLSLRSKEMMLKCISFMQFDFARDGNEDVYYCRLLPRVGGNVAPRHIAQQFSVETIFYPTPIGCHAPEKWLSNKELEILLKCG